MSLRVISLAALAVFVVPAGVLLCAESLALSLAVS